MQETYKGKSVLSLKEFAEYASLSMSKVYKLIQAKEIRSYRKSNKLIYVKFSDVLNWQLCKTAEVNKMVG